MQPEKSPDDDKPDVGGMIGELLSFWAFGPDAHGSEHFHRYHPVKLVVWTLVAIAVSAVVSAVRVALFGEPTVGWAIALFPLLLPLTGAVAHQPPRYVAGLAWGPAAGLVTSLLLGIDIGSSLGSFWTGFASVCAGFLVCSMVFAAVTWPRPEPPE
ncbi:hypothetical protein EDD27_0918 [Nonomuraea polychroma]|uniref:Uncharacterized protein n=1 Tax=Nonomuraea polychroma TaxID=46176 RepID=A0A438LYJ3_9ACTN|nr:hypothetical protein [Nonomuraea polychroma]RVX38596.1 hypothetical protein EDD27_0918 [Nonomuraea polychroma]